MTENTMNRLVEAAKDLDIECDTHLDYSGRGMFGRETCAVSVPTVADFTTLVLRAGQTLPRNEQDGFQKEIRTIRHDSLGMGMIFY